MTDRVDDIPDWGKLWGLPGLAGRVTIRTSRRLSRSIARCYPTRKLINVHPEVFNGPGEFIREILCHELAHVAVHELHGTGCRPHGPEWKELMKRAGFRPRASLPWDHIPPGMKHRRRRSYLHQCPVCLNRRVAGKPMYSWRCRPCVDSGRDGTLVITRKTRRG